MPACFSRNIQFHKVKSENLIYPRKSTGHKFVSRSLKEREFRIPFITRLITFLQLTSRVLSYEINTLDFDAQLRILIVSVDSRELVDELHEGTPYTSLAAVINFNYAMEHGYDYKYLRNFIDVNETRTKYNVDVPDDAKFEDYRSAVTAFHPGLKQYRGATWSKVAA